MRRLPGAPLLAMAATLAGCGQGGKFDDGRRPDQPRTAAITPLERALREVRPDMREGVQDAIRCRRARARAQNSTYRLDAARVRDVAAEYAKDRTIADC